jgi:hypothetical protein
MSSKFSLISGKTQPVQSLCIVGHVNSGICRAAFKIVFENKQPHPVETSFTLPLPAGVCCTHFTVRFNSQKIRARVSRDDATRLEFDDTVAQGDFAVRIEVNDETQKKDHPQGGSQSRASEIKNDATIEIGAMAPGETCKVAVHFAVGLTPLRNGFVLVLPTSITEFTEHFRLGISPPPLSLRFYVHDSRPIRRISTPFLSKSVIDQENGVVTCESLSMLHPFHLLVTYTEALGPHCLFQQEGDHTFIRVIAPIPRSIRSHPSQFTVLLGHDAAIAGSMLGVVLRAIEFFVLSVPLGSRFQLRSFGFYSWGLFDEPVPLNADNMRTAMSLIRKGGDQTAANSTLKIVHRRVVRTIKTGEMQSVIVIVAASLPADLEFDPGHTYFVVDPFARGEVREIVRKKRTGANVIYIPAPSEDGLVPALLSVIKMTEREPFADSRVLVNGVRSPLEPAPLASQTIAWLAAFEGSVTDVVLQAESLVLEIPIAESPLPVLHHLWAYERLNSESEDDVRLARQILAAETETVAAIERDAEVEGDVVHIDAQLGAHGIGWVQKGGDGVPALTPPPPPPPSAVFVRGTTMAVRPPPRVLSVSDVSPEGVVREDKLFTGRMPGSVVKREDALPRKVAIPTGGKRPFFLLRLLQAQMPDGSWGEKGLDVCCGFPVAKDSLGLDRVAFLTAVVITCLRVRAPDEEDKWELIQENGIMFLRTNWAQVDWDSIFEALQRHLTLA